MATPALGWLAVGALLASVPWPGARLEDEPGLPAILTVEAGALGGPFPRGLLGAAHAPRTADVAEEALGAGVPTLRVDANLERVAPARDVRDWRAFDARLAAVAAAGARPLLILDYTPAWLSACPDAATTCPPSDLGLWAALAREAVVRGAALGAVRDVEVWNEPDNPAFWRGGLADYLLLYEAAAGAVRAATGQTGLELRLGGPATFLPDPAWIPPFLAHARARGLPVDFVSYHWYADYPFFGPVGPLPGTGVTDNPLLLARTYGDQALLVRAWTDAAGFTDAEVWVDEWNVNAGDSARSRGPFGAAFVAAVVHAMDRSGAVDGAHYFHLQGDIWGLFSETGEPRPAWKALQALLLLGPVALPAREEGNPNVGAMAAREPDGTVRVLLHHFDAQTDLPVRVRLRAEGLGPARVTITDLEGAREFEGLFPAEGLWLEMPALAVWIAQLSPYAN